jgi:hypothetical protein
MCNKNFCNGLKNKIIFLSTIFGIVIFACAELPKTIEKKVEQTVQGQKPVQRTNEYALKELIDLEVDKIAQENGCSKKTLLANNTDSKSSESKMFDQLDKQEPKLEIKKEAIDSAISKEKCEGKRFVQAKPQGKKENLTPQSTRIVNKSEFIERVVMVSNEITEDMITYKKHWSGHHSPSKFVVTVNDQEIKKGIATPIKVKNDTLAVSYNYEFTALGKVYRTGGKKLEYKVPKEVKKLTSTFSWDTPSNLVLDSCQLIASYDIS